MDNKRKRSRVSFHTKCDLTAGTKALVDLETRDISMKGVYVGTDAGWPIGTDCQVAINLIGGAQPLALHMKGRVARSDTDGLGVDFIEIDMDSFTHLRNIVVYNAPDAEKVIAEVSGSPAFDPGDLK
ncbi:MAG: PilZ domain-containing protein [Deltaproteobacteria bacterium]|nr:PilZ domain-containing protein [Deltaproteobacteria bacterium]MBF0527492.1 PilZ domain-containing protein [Deltaproteobacteria bacterium]